MKYTVRQQLFDLPKNEKIQLAQDLLESVKDEEPLSDEMKALLDERIAEDEAHPEAGIPWEEVKKQLRPRKGTKAKK